MAGEKVLKLVHLFWRSCYVICTIGFCDQASSWSSSCGWITELCSKQSFLVSDWSRVVGSTQLVNHVLGSRASKGEIVTTEQVCKVEFNQLSC